MFQFSLTSVTFVPKTAYSIPADEIQNKIQSGKQFHYFNGIGLIRASMNPNLPNTAFSFRLDGSIRLLHRLPVFVVCSSQGMPLWSLH